MQPTPEQRQAILTRRNAIVVAGAGSGKTRVLVERYLTLLEDHPDWSLNALVAITFTRKAAGEMRDRVRASLEKKRLAAADPQARDRWSDLLSAMDSARITTIHGLCADLLRANAAEARIDPDFGVLDDTEAAILLGQAIDDTFKAIAAEDHAALRVFDLFDPREVRAVLTSELMGVDLPDLPADLGAFWRNQWLIFAGDLFQLWIDQPIIREAAEWLTHTPFPDGDKRSDVCQLAKQALFALIDQPDPLKRFDLLLRLTKGGGVIDFRGGSKKVWGEAAFEDSKRILEGIRDSADQLRAHLGEPIGAIDDQAAEIVPAWHALIRTTQDTYRTYKRRANRLDFNDLERLTAELLRDHRHVQRRYQGAEFQHLLVDEFQDTNSAQWEIAQALSGLTRPGSLFVVGDPKQSIYAFRGADVSVFHEVHDEILRAGGEQIDLRRSFRTHERLVNTLNHLFEQILRPDEHSPVHQYQVALGQAMDAHRLDAPNEHPALELLLLDGSADKLGTDMIRQWEARLIAERIRHLVEGEQRIIYDKEHDTLRPIGYGDVAILFQSMSKAPLYEEVFRQFGLPFLTVAGRGYYDRQEVWDLLNLLSALHQPADDLSLACALRSPLFQVSDDGLYALRLTGLPLWQALAQPDDRLPEDQRDRVQMARDTLRELQRIAGRVTISELLRETLARTGYLATLTGLPNGALRRGNVEKLLSLAHASGKITLGAFTAYLRDLTTREVREGDAALEVEGVVRLMTVHASKGLEFPLVILADASWESKPKQGLITYRDGLCCKIQTEDGNWSKPFIYQRALKLQELREEAERRRLLYVAATRAQDLLIISGKAECDKWSVKGWLDWIMGVFEGNSADVLIQTPAYSPPADSRQPEEARSAWEIDPPKVTPITPILIHPIKPTPMLQTRHLAPSQITQIGLYVSEPDEHARREARRRFRQSIFYDAPETIPAARYERSQRVSARQVGEIVHEALRWWPLPFEQIAPDQRRRLLLSYAWEQGITEQHDLDDAIHRAEGLLNGFIYSTLYRWILDAVEANTAIYRELPFVYEYDSHIIRGVIDILFHHPDGHWILADYKTSRVHWKDRSSRLMMLQRHAQRYHLQLGIYAAAVSAELGQTPQVYINYLSEGELFALTETQWRSALQTGLQSAIQPLLDR